MRVALVSPNRTLRVGLRELLSAQGFEINAEAAGLDEISFDETDVLVLASVSSAFLSALNDFPAVLLLSDDVEDARALQSARTKAWGVIPLNATEDELSAAVHAVGEGLWVAAPAFGAELMRGRLSRQLLSGEEAPEALTAREAEILQLLARGLANKQIAVSLGISDHTVKFHVSSIFVKLGVSGRTEAVSRGLSLGLVSL